MADSTYFSEANSIFINGKDVYIAGYIQNSSGYYVATYWKNGVMVKLTDGTSNAEAYSIGVQGNDVFVVGNANIIFAPVYSNGTITTTPTLWKNGVATELPQKLKFLAKSHSALASNGSILYIAGGYIASNNKDVISYWENGNVKNLTDSTTSSEVFAIAAIGQDIYLAGVNQSYDQTGNVVFSGAAYWKNGVITHLENVLNSQGNDIAVDNENVYVAGITYSNNQEVAVYWENGHATLLGDLSTNSFANAIAVSHGDIYIAGVSGDDAVYWKNGVLTRLTANASVSAIAIVSQ